MMLKTQFSHLLVFTLCCLPFFLHKYYTLVTAHVSSPSHSASHHLWPISSLCCVWLSGWGRGWWWLCRRGGRPALRPLHMFSIPPHRPRLSSFGLLLPSHLSSLLVSLSFFLFMSTKLSIRLSACLPAGLPVCGMADNKIISKGAKNAMGDRY